ncbi:MAG: diguanylate cyclase [Clostridia bacterium]|nr:diguanylate cyclase [Clostridia bacterium]
MRKPNRTTVFIILICVLLVVVNISLGFVLIRQSSASMRDQIESRMLDISNTAAAMLDGDVLGALEADDENTEGYRNSLKILKCYQDNIDLAYIYGVRATDDGRFTFMIDPSDDPGEFGEEIEYTDALYQASLGVASVDKVPYEDRWGKFYSAYSPVFDSNGKVSGIVAVDFSASWYDDQIAEQMRTTFLVTGISILVIALIVALFGTRFRKLFRNLLNEVNVVSDGIETLVNEMSPGAAAAKRKKDAGATPTNYSATELGIRLHSLEDQLGEQINLVRSLAYVDGLTGLENRTAYEDHVKRLDDEIADGTAKFAVIVYDLNELKEINDKNGHDAGDRALLKIAVSLIKAFPEAAIYRTGGDEFAVIIEGDCQDISERLERVDKALAEGEPIASAKGFSVFDAGTDMYYREVYKRADNAMYDDKKAFYISKGADRRQRTGKNN